MRGENRSTRRKTSQSRVENQQQTQPTYDAGSGNRTRDTLVGGECSHHCANPAPLEMEWLFQSVTLHLVERLWSSQFLLVASFHIRGTEGCVLHGRAEVKLLVENSFRLAVGAYWRLNGQHWSAFGYSRQIKHSHCMCMHVEWSFRKIKEETTANQK